MPISVLSILQPGALLVLAVMLLAAGCSHGPPFGSTAQGPAEGTVEAAGSAGDTAKPGPETEPLDGADVTRPAGITTGSAARTRLQVTLADSPTALASENVGYFMDVQEARLRQDLAETPVLMQRDANTLQLTIPGKLSFGIDSADLLAAAKPVLKTIARVIAEFDGTLVTVQGNTDDRGDADYNRQLSEQRAVAVALILTKHGVSRQRLVAIGQGEHRPVSRVDSEAARTANRRVEIRIEPIVAAGKTG